MRNAMKENVRQTVRSWRIFQLLYSCMKIPIMSGELVTLI